VRRAAPALIATAGALGVLATFHSSPAKPTVLATTASPPTPADAPTVPTTTTTSAPPPSTETVAPRTTTTLPAARAITGQDIWTQFGDVRVQAVLRGQQLIDVRSIRLPFSHARSRTISDYAAPRLRAEALRAQSANVDLISGATYTSEAYIQSLQSALDVARGR